MRKKLTITLAATIAAAVCTACVLTSIAVADSDERRAAVTTVQMLPVSEEFIAEQNAEHNLRRDECGKDISVSDNSYSPNEIIITHNPITPEFIA